MSPTLCEVEVALLELRLNSLCAMKIPPKIT